MALCASNVFDLADLHPQRRHGTRNHLGWESERLEDLRPRLER